MYTYQYIKKTRFNPKFASIQELWKKPYVAWNLFPCYYYSSSSIIIITGYFRLSVLMMDTFHKTTKYFWLGLITPSFASIKLWASFRQVPIMTGHPVK